MAKSRVYNYEAMFLLSQAVAADLSSAIEHIKELIARANGEIIALRKWDERRLAYEIAGQKRGVDYPWFLTSDFVKTPQCVSVTAGCPTDRYGFKPFVYGNSGRNILRGPDWQSLDLSLQKSFPVRRANLNLRWDVFNVFNTVNLGLPDANIANTATVGQIRSLSGDPRLMQFSVRVQF